MAPPRPPSLQEAALQDLYVRLDDIDNAIRSLEELQLLRKRQSLAVRRILDSFSISRDFATAVANVVRHEPERFN